MRNNRILMYHSVGWPVNDEAGSELYCVSVEKFREQMKYISTIDGSQSNKVTKSQVAAGKVTVTIGDSHLVSFDDGLLDNYTNAYSVLKEFGLKAYFFILVGKIGTQGFMDWQQVGELRNAGMIIGSHGMTHRILTELNDMELDYELIESKKILEDKLKQPIGFFSVPRGFYNKKIIDKAREAGYKAVFTSDLNDSDGFKFGRIPVKSDWELSKFIQVVNNGLSVKDKAADFMKLVAKKLLGVRKYDRLRSEMLKK